MVEMSSNLLKFWCVRVDPGSDVMLEQPYGYNVIITEVAFADPIHVQQNVALKASVETLLMDQPEVNGDRPSITRDMLIASFLPGQPRARTVNTVFSSSDICYLEAIGTSLVVSGYIEKSNVRLSDYASV